MADSSEKSMDFLIGAAMLDMPSDIDSIRIDDEVSLVNGMEA